MRIVFCVLMLSAIACADNLWGESEADPLRVEKKKFDVHSHITINVKEKSQASANTALTTDRRSRWNEDLRKMIRFSFDQPGAQGEPRIRQSFGTLDGVDLASPSIDAEGRFREDNTGKTTRDANLTFQITANVVQVLPNGNLVIEAKKTRQINGETETMTLSGEVAQDAVDALTDTVDSEKIANLDVRYDGNGSVGDVAHPGLLSKILNEIWPFW